VRDAVAAEGRDVPTAIVLNGALSSIANETARLAGLPAMSIVSVNQPLFGLARSEIAATSVPIQADLVRSLTE
jgi:hypothetical protein